MQFFENGTATVGPKEVAFTRRRIRDRFEMFVPESFIEDTNLVSNYTYLFSKDKSPLSIAIKFTSCTGEEEAERLISQYFNQAMETLDSLQVSVGNVRYRETVTESKYISVYSLRFSVEVRGGVLFGCFNCSAEYKNSWREVVLNMLEEIRPVQPA